jgi:hypothetical protein
MELELPLRFSAFFVPKTRIDYSDPPQKCKCRKIIIRNFRCTTFDLINVPAWILSWSRLG